MKKCIICKKEATDKHGGQDWCGDEACGIKIQEAKDEIEDIGTK